MTVLADYAEKYASVRMRREDGILEMQFHTDGGPLRWGKRAHEDLESAFQDETGHGQDEDLGLVWMEKSYDLAATTGPDGELHVMLGVWGTFEVTRTYYVDAVLITFTRAEAQRSS